jgi:hypothetical protein
MHEEEIQRHHDRIRLSAVDQTPPVRVSPTVVCSLFHRTATATTLASLNRKHYSLHRSDLLFFTAFFFLVPDAHLHGGITSVSHHRYQIRSHYRHLSSYLSAVRYCIRSCDFRCALKPRFSSALLHATHIAYGQHPMLPLLRPRTSLIEKMLNN